MPFKQVFDSVTTEEEKQSDLYKLLSQIGVLTEKAIYEAIDAEMRNSVEPMAFTETRLRSWLAFFLKKVPNSRAANGRATMRLAEGHRGFSLPRGSPIQATNGLVYTLDTDLVVPAAVPSTEFAFYQGTPGAFTSIYREYLSIPVAGIDITYGFRVMLPDGREVPPCPEVKYGDLPSMADEMALEQRLALRQMVTRGYIRPENGYFAFYLGDRLYIKIYPGFPNPANPAQFFTPNPEGLNIRVEYIVCDGLAGVLRGNTVLTTFEEAIVDTVGTPVEYTLQHPAVTNGYDPPAKFQLVALFREFVFARHNVATVPEYEAWFRAQPELGDAKVVGDFERWVGGRNSYRGQATDLVPVEVRDEHGNITEVRWEEQTVSVGSDYTVTGIVEAFLITSEAEPVNPTQAHVWGDLLVSVSGRIRQVQDLAVITYSAPTPVQFFMEVEYYSAIDPGAFTISAIDIVQRFFNPHYVWAELQDSLFNDLELSPIRALLQEQYSPSGLHLQAYHFRAISVPGTSNAISLPHYDGEESGGWYEFVRFSEASGRMERLARFREFDLPNEPYTHIYWLCEISPEPVWFRVGFRHNGEISVNSPFFAGLSPSWVNGGVVWGDFPTFPVQPFGALEAMPKGRFDSGQPKMEVSAAPRAATPPQELRCYWRLADRGVARIGSWTGYRQLSSSRQGGGVRVRSVQ